MDSSNACYLLGLQHFSIDMAIHESSHRTQSVVMQVCLQGYLMLGMVWKQLNNYISYMLWNEVCFKIVFCSQFPVAIPQ